MGNSSGESQVSFLLAGNSSGEKVESQLSFPLVGNSRGQRQMRFPQAGNSGGQISQSRDSKLSGQLRVGTSGFTFLRQEEVFHFYIHMHYNIFLAPLIYLCICLQPLFMFKLCCIGIDSRRLISSYLTTTNKTTKSLGK